MINLTNHCKRKYEFAKRNIIQPASVKLNQSESEKVKKLVKIYTTNLPADSPPSHFCLRQRSQVEGLLKRIISQERPKDESNTKSLIIEQSCELPKTKQDSCNTLPPLKKQSFLLRSSHKKISSNSNFRIKSKSVKPKCQESMLLRRNNYANILKERDKRSKKKHKRAYDVILKNAMSQIKIIHSSAFGSDIRTLMQKFDNLSRKNRNKSLENSSYTDTKAAGESRLITFSFANKAATVVLPQ